MNCRIELETIDKRTNESMKDYHERAYIVFKETLMKSKVLYSGLPVKVREIPIEDNKVQGFFHVISEQDKRSGIRLYKDERVKYIPFISKLIMEFDKCENCTEPCPKIKIWTAPYLGKESIQRVKIYYEKYDYIVILEKRKDYYQLVTAYVVDRKDRRDDLLREYKKYSSKTEKGMI